MMRQSPFRRFLLLECVAAICGLVLFGIMPLLPAMGLAALFAAIAAYWWHDGPWWCLIHAIFLPLIVLAQQFPIEPYWYLLAFCVCWLVFSPVLRHRVPLYLTGRPVLDILAQEIPAKSRFLDVGAGLGTVLRHLAKHRPDLTLCGIELAFLPCLYGRLSLPKSIEWQGGSYASLDLARYDVVYAFLSPAPMADLWAKAVREMRPGSLFISNTFTVPDLPAHREIAVKDWKNGKLFIWKM